MSSVIVAQLQDGWTSVHYSIWGIARTLGLVGKNEKFEASDVKVTLEIFNHLVNQGANLRVGI